MKIHNCVFCGERGDREACGGEGGGVGGGRVVGGEEEACRVGGWEVRCERKRRGKKRRRRRRKGRQRGILATCHPYRAHRPLATGNRGLDIGGASCHHWPPWATAGHRTTTGHCWPPSAGRPLCRLATAEHDSTAISVGTDWRILAKELWVSLSQCFVFQVCLYLSRRLRSLSVWMLFYGGCRHLGSRLAGGSTFGLAVFVSMLVFAESWGLSSWHWWWLSVDRLQDQWVCNCFAKLCYRRVQAVSGFGRCVLLVFGSRNCTSCCSWQTRRWWGCSRLAIIDWMLSFVFVGFWTVTRSRRIVSLKVFLMVCGSIVNIVLLVVTEMHL